MNTEENVLIEGGKDMTSPKINYFEIQKLLENYSIFGKFEFGKFLPLMAIPNFKFGKL
jgi:hypothetical protein